MEITVKKVDYGFDVYHDGKIAKSLGYDEMLGLVSAISMPEQRPHLHWLKTPEQIEKENENFLKKHGNDE